MKRVQLESPFGNEDKAVVAANVEYARRCARDCLINRDEAPFASHLLYTQMLDDRDQKERNIGIDAGFVWMLMTERVVVYVDRGISTGMRLGIAAARKREIPVVFRELRPTNDGGYTGVDVEEPTIATGDLR